MMPLLISLYWLATAVQLLFWTVFYSRLAFYRSPARSDKQPDEGVSVIICAHNEADTLSRNLFHFLNQNYRSYEIIVVDDNSIDQTANVLLEFQNNWPNLRVISLRQPTLPGKKQALSLGIEAARYDLLLLSDADCAPASPDWLHAMQAAIAGEVEVGLGYSPYRREPGMLNRFIRFEAVHTAIQYLSLALAGYPYMGVGRNLIYRKRLYRRSGGFNLHQHIISGDDDLFVNAVANRWNTDIILERGAFVYSDPKRTWRGYYFQKRRHVSTGRTYKFFHQLLLGLYSASHAGHYVIALALLLFGAPMTLVFLTYLVRIGVVATLYHRILFLLHERSLWKWIPLFDASFVFYYFILAPVLLTGNVKRWK